MHIAVSFWNGLKHLFAHNGSILAGFISYTILVSLFPLTIFLFALAGFFKQEILAQNLLGYGFTLLPAEIASTLQPILLQIIGQQRPGLLTVGILGTVWAASAGVEALRDGLNTAYDVQETRPLWKRRLQSLLTIFIAAAVGLLVSGLVVLGPVILAWAERYIPLPQGALAGIGIVRYLVSFTLLTAFLCAIYRFLPNASQHLRDTLPGALLACLGWLALASLFSLYLTYFGHYDKTYGSLGGVVITLLFLQATALIFLLGGEFNGQWKKTGMAGQDAVKRATAAP